MLRLFAENNLCVFWLLSDGLKEKKIDNGEEGNRKRNVEVVEIFIGKHFLSTQLGLRCVLSQI